MKFLIVLMFLVGLGYAWFSMGYEPKPSGDSMQGVISKFQQAILDKDIEAMRRCCLGDAMETCNRIMDRLNEYESRTGYTVGRVGTLGFDYTRGRKTVDGMMEVFDTDGDSLMHFPIIRVEQQDSGGAQFWAITLIQGV